MGAIVRSFGLTSGYTDFDSKRKSDSHRFEVRRTRHWAVDRKAESMQRESTEVSTLIFGLASQCGECTEFEQTFIFVW